MRILIAQREAVQHLQAPFAICSEPKSIFLLGEALIAAARNMEAEGTTYGWVRIDTDYSTKNSAQSISPWKLK